jgi:glycosidase
VVRAKLLRSLALATCAAALSGACRGPSYPTVACDHVVWARASAAANVSVVGSWDGWTHPIAMVPAAQPGWQVAVLTLPAGDYGYEVVTDGAAALDPFQPLTTFDGEVEVSLLVATDCRTPQIAIQAASADDTGAMSVSGVFSAAAGGPPLDPRRVSATLDGAPDAAAASAASAADGTFSIAAKGLAPGKHTVSVQIAATDGATATASAAVWVKPAAETWDDAVLYQIVTDRFRGDGGAVLSSPPTPGTRAGGTLGGITAEIEAGTFAALGVTALWISPVYTNPDGFYPDGKGHVAEGYHGYWVAADRSVEPKIGGEAALRTLVATAHAHGLRVLFDIVPNEIHDANPLYAAHRTDGFFDTGTSACVCGAPGCPWATYILTCWFASYLPDIRYQDEAAMQNAVADALFWTQQFDADGVRIDAVPMMPRATTRRIVSALRASEAPARAQFALGEIFTSGGLPGFDYIKYYLGPNGLDSAFDFPLMWAMNDAIATNAGGFDEVESVLAMTEQGLAGSGSVPARMLDNHDTARFLSVASGDDLNDAWGAPPAQPPTGATAYALERLALALVFALPGMPVVYYGDELGLAGASDPDSRRVMPALSALLPDQQTTLALTKRLGTLRRCMTALRRGARVPVWDDADTLAFARDAGDGAPALALFSRSSLPTTISIPGGVVPAGAWVDALSGAQVTLDGPTMVSLAPLSFEILVPASSPCRP